MNLRLEGLRSVDSSRLVLNADGTGAQKGGCRFWIGSTTPSPGPATSRMARPSHQQQNRDFKEAFYQSLVTTERRGVADAALRRASLPTNWRASPAALSSGNVSAVLERAEQIRTTVLAVNQQRAIDAATGMGPNSLSGVFAARKIPGKLPTSDGARLSCSAPS